MFNTIKVNNTDTNYTHSIFDISGYNSGAIYANLSAALAAVPQNKKQGGMTVKFIQQITLAQYSVVKTEELETEPSGTLLSEAPYIDSGTYDENQLSTVFSTLPSAIGESHAVTYYVAVTVDETTTYTSWVITKVLDSDNKYTQYRLMTTTWSDVVSDWQGISKKIIASNDVTESNAVLGELYTKSVSTLSEVNLQLTSEGEITTPSSQNSIIYYTPVFEKQKVHIVATDSRGDSGKQFRVGFTTNIPIIGETVVGFEELNSFNNYKPIDYNTEAPISGYLIVLHISSNYTDMTICVFEQKFVEKQDLETILEDYAEKDSLGDYVKNPEIYTETPKTPSNVNLQLTPDGEIVTASSIHTQIYYIPVVQGQKVHVTGTDTGSTGLQFRVGFTANVPAIGETVVGLKNLSVTDDYHPVDYSANAPINGYFIVNRQEHHFINTIISTYEPKFVEKQELDDILDDYAEKQELDDLLEDYVKDSEIRTETPQSPSEVNLQLNHEGIIVEATSSGSTIYYIPVIQGQKIHVTGTDDASSSIGLQFRVGFTTNVPSIGETVVGFNELSSSDNYRPVDYFVWAPISGYFIVLHIATRYIDTVISFYESKFVEKQDLDDILDDYAEKDSLGDYVKNPEIYTETPKTPSNVNLQLNSEGIIVEATSQTTTIYYIPVIQGQKVHVTGTDDASSSTGLQFRVGFTANVPAVGETVVGFNELSSSDNYRPVDYSVNSPISGYFIVLHQSTHYSDMIMSSYEPKFVEKQELEPDDTYRNIHMAFMNLTAKRLGMNSSLWLAPQGSSYTTPKDMCFLAMAAMTNNILSSVWGKETYDAPLYKSNGVAAVDHTDSTYNDVVSHPVVAALKDYYHIFGGKTGSGNGSPDVDYRIRNLVVVVKSKVDNSCLVGCVMHCTVGDTDEGVYNRFAVAKELFDLLETKRTGAAVDPSGLNCRGAYAIAVPTSSANLENYQDAELVTVSKNGDTFFGNSKSMAKLMTAYIATRRLDMQSLLTIKTSDISTGTGNTYVKGDTLIKMDGIINMMLPSSNTLARTFARYVGMEFMNSRIGRKIYSFGVLNKVCFGENVQTWIEWLSTSDYLLFHTKYGITLTCAGENENVLCGGQNLLLDSNSIKGSDTIFPNSLYSTEVRNLF